MKKILLPLLFPLMMFSQDSTLTGDVDCSGEVNSQDASLILQFVTNVIDSLPCQDNMTGLTPEQLQEIINMIDEQLSINYTGGGSSNYPAMISSRSSEEMTLGEAFVYCNDLEEGGHSDWFLPNLDQLTYAISGGCELPDERTDITIWSTTFNENSTSIVLGEETGNIFSYGFNFSGVYCRCVRFGEGETSEGSIGSSNSSDSGSSIAVSSIAENSEQPITMIGPMYRYDDFPSFIHSNSLNTGPYPQNHSYLALKFFDAVRFCKDLEYNGYNDWYLPSLNQVWEYYISNDLFEINNFNDVWELQMAGGYDPLYTYVSSLNFWTISESETDMGARYIFSIRFPDVITVNGNEVDLTNTLTDNVSDSAHEAVNGCVCVR